MQDWIELIGWALIHTLWQGGVLAGSLAALLFVLRHASPQIRYTAACATLASLALCPLVTCLWIGSPQRPVTTPIFEPRPAANMTEPAVQDASPTTTPPHATTRPTQTSRPSPPVPPTSGPAVPPPMGWAWGAQGVQVLAPWLVTCWLAGVTLTLLRLGGGWWRAMHWTRFNTEPIGETWERRCQQLADRMGVRRPVRWMRSVAAPVPMVVGALRPVVLMPASAMTGLSPQQIESVLLHELAHIRRHDYLVNLLQCVIEALLFYHPAVWWIGGVIRQERELCCDDAVLRLQGERLCYAQALARLAEANTPLHTTAKGGRLPERVQRILGFPPASRWLPRTQERVIVLLLLSLAVTGMGVYCQPIIAERYNAYQQQVLHQAVRDGDLQRVRHLLSEKPWLVEAVDPAGHTPLHQALISENQAIATLLRAAGAPPVIVIQTLDPETGAPLPHVPLELRLERDTRQAQTDERGRYLLELTGTRPAQLRGTTRLPGHVAMVFAFERKRSSVNYPEVISLPLERAIAIGGRILNEADQPVADVTVHTELWGPSASDGLRVHPHVHDTVQTDDQGRWVSHAWPANFSQPRLRLEHPAYVSDEYAARREPPSLPSLKDKRSVMILQRGFPLRGQVLDAEGQPVPSAHVTLNPTHYAASHYPQTRTDDQGAFAFSQVRPGPALVTVRAEGLAPDLQEVMVSADLESLHFQLESGHTLHGRVITRNGTPIEGATVQARHWRDAASLPWRGRTDDDGRFVWHEAPSDEVRFDIHKPGYINRWHHPMQANGGENRVELIPVLEMTGSVTDAATGQPIERYTLVPGFGSSRHASPHWSRLHAVLLSESRFEYTLHEERPVHYVRVEADGYEPRVSPPLEATGEPITLTFELEPVRARMTRQILLPNGAPAAQTKGFILPESQSYLGLLRGEPDAPESFASVITDDRGQFTLASQGEPAHLVFLHPTGYAALDPSALAGGEPVQLTPWGRIEGVLQRAGKPLANERISINVFETPLRPHRVNLTARAITDTQGRFTLDYLPAGHLQVVHEVSTGLYRSRHLASQRVTIKPGQTVPMPFGGDGTSAYRQVTGTLDVPNLGDHQLTFMSISSHVAWYEDRADPQDHFQASIGAQGSFSIPDVLPGTYRMTINAAPPDNDVRDGSRIRSSAFYYFTLPAADAPAVHDLGRITVLLLEPDEPLSLDRITDQTDLPANALHLAIPATASGLSAELDPHRRIQLLALGRDGQWWQPDGTPISTGITLAPDLWPTHAHHTLALLRVEGDEVAITQAAYLDRSAMRPFVRLARIGSGPNHLATLEHRRHSHANLFLRATWPTSQTPANRSIELLNMALRPGPRAHTEAVVHDVPRSELLRMPSPSSQETPPSGMRPG